MDTVLIDKISFKVDVEALMERLRVRPGSADSRDFAALVVEAEAIARPKAIFGAGRVEERNPEEVVIAGERFSSRVLRVNLDRAEQVYPFVSTCGMELQEWGEAQDDMIWSFWAEAIKEEALRAAMVEFQEVLRAQFQVGHLSTMSPGSLENWPISQQQPLFHLLGNPVEVHLTDSLLMIPTKSVSGIVFPTEADFESCKLCPRQNCAGRRAPYDETLFAREYCPAS